MNLQGGKKLGGHEVVWIALICVSWVLRTVPKRFVHELQGKHLCLEKLLWDCTFACDPDIDAFFTFLWRRDCLSDQIQFVSVYLIASGLHNSRPAKWGQLHGLMGVISNLEGSLAVIDLQHNIVCLKNRKRSNMIAFIWNRLEAASWSIVTTPWSIRENAGLTFAWCWQYWHVSLCWTILCYFIEILNR